MGYMARWGPKGFLVSKSKIVPMIDLKTSLTLKEDSENDTSGTPPKNTRGRELQPLTFSTIYTKAAGTDPRAQFAEWEKLLGMYYPLIIGGRRFGPQYLKLKGVEMSNVQITPAGEILMATIMLTFEEHSDGKTTKLASVGGTGTGGTGAEEKPAATPTGGTTDSTGAQGITDAMIGTATKKNVTPSQVNRLDAMNAAPTKSDKAMIKNTPSVIEALNTMVLAGTILTNPAASAAVVGSAIGQGAHNAMFGKGG